MIKKEIRNLPKKFMEFAMLFAILFSYFAPITTVFAESSTKELSVSFRDDNANYGIVQYSLNNGTNWNDVTENTENINTTVTGDNLKLKIVPNNGYSVDYAGIELYLDEEKVENVSNLGLDTENGYSIPSDIQSVSLTQVEFREGENNNQGQHNENNTTSKVTIQIIGEELEYDNEWSDEATDFVFGINNSQMYRLLKTEVNYTRENEKIAGLTTKNEINYGYAYDNEGTTTFNIKTQWDDVITSLTINGITYNTPKTKEELSAAFDKQFRGIRFDIPNVPYAETYNIVVVGRKQTENEKIMGNFGWTYDPNTNEYSDDDKILYGNLEFVKAVYNGVTYNTPEEVNATGGVFEWNNGVKGTNDPTGEAMFPTGTELTLKLIPDSGYQLTSFDLNGFPFEAGEDTGLYTFTIGGGNWHLGAHFTEVSDEVQANSQNIKSGNININKSDDTNFENGTAKLEINDIANMSTNRTKEFENTATKEGYELENYLDISLYNTIYKGGNKDANGNYESWDTLIENIEKKATITLELKENMSGKDLAIIHEKHEGDTITGYELIDATYNEKNNTITFETDSFSNYAIVSKDLEDDIEYTINNDLATVIFKFNEGHKFVLDIKDLLTMTPDKIQSNYGIDEDTFKSTIELIKNNVKQHGELISLYDITIDDGNLKYSDSLKLKLKLTETMKKYNTLKLVYLDENDDLKAKDVKDLTINSKTADVDLDHLSTYALVGSNTETSETNTANNPKTGDNIHMWVGLSLISVLGLSIVTIKKSIIK